MTADRRRFVVTAPDWGQDHLTLDAIVAFVDDELSDGARARAAAHLRRCPECAAEVVAQAQARTELRTAAGPDLPSSLLSSLRSIPQDTDLPGPPAGLAVTTDGQLVSVLREERRAGPNSGAAGPPAGAAGATGRRRTASRRLGIGAGVAVSGLALGALAFSVPASSAVASHTDRGVLGGSVLGGGPQARASADGPAQGAPGPQAVRGQQRDRGEPGGADSRRDVRPGNAPGAVTVGPASVERAVSDRLERLPAAFRLHGGR
jgi:anti-sigma factor RsiW